MSTTASPLALRLFLEGVEVPVISADVQSTLDGPGATASVQVIATPEVGRIRPRTLVHLFFLDVGTEGTYRLLFCGEVSGISIGKTESSRNATLECRDFRSYFDAAYTYLMTQSDIRGDAGGDKALLGLLQSQAAFTGATTGFTQIVNNTIEQFISNLLKDPKPSSWGFQDTTGLLGGLLHLIEVFTGLNERDKPGINQFFTFAEARLKLLGQIGVYDKDQTASRLFSSEASINFIAQRLDSLGSLTPLSRIISSVLQYMYYRISPNPSARYIPTARKNREVSSPCAASAAALRQELQALYESSVTPREREASRGFVLETLSKFFPVGASLFTFRDALDSGDAGAAARAGSVENPAVYNLLRDVADAPMDLRRMAITVAETLISVSSANVPTPTLFSLLVVCSGHLLTLERWVSVDSVDESSRLYTTLVMPDLFFAVAPTCNVVFPDMYYSAQYSRDMLREATRMHLATDIGQIAPGSIAGIEVYYAPSVEALTDLQSKALSLPTQEGVVSAQKPIGSLFDHELNTGIIPTFSTMSRMSLEMASNLENSDLKTDFFTRIANMQFLQQRLSARNMSLSGVFNPYIAVGFPTIVIDKGVGATSDTRAVISRGDIQGLEQYIGLCVSVNHSVSQTGGSTSYQLQNVRAHRSKDDPYLQQLAFRSEVEPTLQDIIVDGESLLGELSGRLESGREVDIVAEFKLLIDSNVGIVGTAGVDYIGDVSPTLILDRAGLMGPRLAVPTYGSNASQIVSRQVLDASPVGGSIIKDGVPSVVDNADTSDDFKRELTNDIWEGLSNEQMATASLFAGGVGADAYTLLLRVVSAAVDSGYTAKQSLSDQDLLSVMYIYANTRRSSRFPIPAYRSMRIGVNLRSGARVKPPVEEAMRPLYLDPAYASPNIGRDVYMPLLGVRSVVDITETEAARYGAEFVTTVVGVSQGAGTRAEQARVLPQEDAIDIITLKYSSEATSDYWLKQVRRPIATLDEVLGDGGFHDIAHATEAEAASSKRIPLLGAAYRSPDGEAVPPGMRELSREQLERLEASVDTRIDTRAERKRAVLSYSQSLQSRGLLG